jgi:hypothetical protein
MRNDDATWIHGLHKRSFCSFSKVSKDAAAYKFWHHEQEEKIFCQLRAVKSSASSEKATGKLK